jgi:hypothetical protein
MVSLITTQLGTLTDLNLDVSEQFTFFEGSLNKVASLREGGFQDRASDLIRLKTLQVDELLEENRLLGGLKAQNELLKETIGKLREELKAA